jgi:Glycosyltransferase family 87
MLPSTTGRPVGWGPDHVAPKWGMHRTEVQAESDGETPRRLLPPDGPTQRVPGWRYPASPVTTAHDLPADADRHAGFTRMSRWLPGAALVALLLVPLDRIVDSARIDILAIDFRQTFLPAAEKLLDGSSPYPEYAYPPLVAFLSVPFALTPSPEVFVTVAIAACVPATLWLLGVRDWRCYVAAFLWVSVFNAVQTANVTLPILLAAAVCWRWREHTGVMSAAGGLAVAAKVLAWPLIVWLAFSRRTRAAIGAVLVAVGVTFGLWATLGFSGLRSYPDSVNNAQGTYGEQGYTFGALALDAGLPEEAGVLVSLACLVVVLAGVVVYARRADDRRSFACATIAMILASPIIWLHSFAFLLAPVALLRPRLSPIWLLPALLWFASPGTGNGDPWQTVVTMGTAVVVALVVLLVPADRSLRGRFGARASRTAEPERP